MSADRLAGRTALVTGASRGIGQAIAIAFAAEGADVAITARGADALASTRAQIERAGRRCESIAADLEERGAARRVFDSAVAGLGPIDILVNDAGIGSSASLRPVVDFDDAFWERTLYLNLTVPYLLTRYCLPSMMERRNGRIIQIASIAGKIGTLHGAAYSASKHGLLGLTRSVAIETAAFGITVNAICPGSTHTRVNDMRISYDAERLGMPLAAFETTLTPIGRRLEPAEIAPLAVYLASPDARVVTGQAYNIDGGALMI